MNLRALASAAAATLTGLQAPPAAAVSAPEQGLVSIKAMDYQDRQDSAQRIRVQALSTHWVVPLNAAFSLELGTVVDSISGASPAYYTAPSSMAKVDDLRRAEDAKIAYHWNGQRLSLGQVQSRENDYDSRTHLLAYTVSDESNNNTWDIGTAITQDTINPVNRLVTNASKNSREWLIGWTRVLTPRDIVQAQWIKGWGHGYYSDPYKFLDHRPDHKAQTALTVRWNHHMAPSRTSVRLSARWSKDSYEVNATTLGLEFAQPVGLWTFTPSLRLYSQSAASFFSPPDPAHPDFPAFAATYEPGVTPISFDQRLAAYGARTWGFKIARQIDARNQIDFKIDRYQQRNDWSWHGPATPGLADFHAQTLYLGWTHRFRP